LAEILNSPLPTGEGLGVRVAPLDHFRILAHFRFIPHPLPFSLREKGVKLPSTLVGEGLGVRASPLSPRDSGADRSGDKGQFLLKN